MLQYLAYTYKKKTRTRIHGPWVSRPIPVPERKVTGTRTRAWGMGTLRVGVRVGVKIPTGYPCPTLG